MAKKKHVGVYPGTFDPVTKGHLDIIKRGRSLFDELIIGVAESTSKTTLFSVAERLAMIRAEVKGVKGVRVESFDTLLVDYVTGVGAQTVLRGLRVISDFEYEFQMALTNRKIEPKVETVFMMTQDNFAPISSRFIKEIARFGGDVSHFVTPKVARRLKSRFD
ncbi:MAG: pantetheine-phosphate adenylyltransferase [Proteobacteria bacterium]|nr:pantetheine-phosphate adenylyltransferase [Pseudomonadota bacterium]